MSINIPATFGLARANIPAVNPITGKRRTQMRWRVTQAYISGNINGGPMRGADRTAKNPPIIPRTMAAFMDAAVLCARTGQEYLLS
jgi:hypothetical protein